jgi:hypothetical protein
VKTLRTLPAVLVLGALLAAGSATAQFVSFSRCRAAYPCLIPFAVQYHPDPLLAAQYGQVGNTALSARVELQFPLKLEIDRPLDQKAVDAAMRKSVEVHAPSQKTLATEPPAIEAPKPKPPSEER